MKTEGENKVFRISAKNLGALAMGDFCPRCFWIDYRLGSIPSPFPGIFSSIDAFTKRTVRNYIRQHATLPRWGAAIGEISGFVDIKTKEFRFHDKVSDSLLTGVPDEVLKMSDGTYTILDYKTARYTEGQDALLPIYEVQLGAYKFIAEKTGYSPVLGLDLVYFEPPENDPKKLEKATEEGFTMNFSAKVVPIKKQVNVLGLLRKAKAIYSGEIPEGLPGCQSCAALSTITTGLAAF